MGDSPETLWARLQLVDKGSILVFSGAGISTESGIPDFRGENGLWKKVDPDDFTISRYLTNEDLRVSGWRMHAEGQFWGARSGARPNRGHEAVVTLSDAGRLAGVVTQNVDGLHQLAGLDDTQVAEVHGNVRTSHCTGCEQRWATEQVLARVDAGDADPHCQSCGSPIKTDVIMFGEELRRETLERSYRFLEIADALLVLGSTVAVWPASDVVMAAALKQIPIVIINKGATEADHLASAVIDGSIGENLPHLVSSII